ncbi:hypothetical protein ACFE04_007038 [Oxalis oulophora]
MGSIGITCNSGASNLLQYNGLRHHVDNTIFGGSSPKGYLAFSVDTKRAEKRIIRAMASPTTSTPKREKDPKERIVITGMGIVSVFGNDIDTFYDKLLQGESGVSFIDRFDVTTFSTKFAAQIQGFSSEDYIDKKNDLRFDDYIRYCLVAGKRALQHANLSSNVLQNMDRARIGTIVGTGIGGIMTLHTGKQALMAMKRMSPFCIPFTITNMASSLLAIDVGLNGPCYSISTAGATSNYCFQAAANHIRRGEVDIMVTGGAESPIHPLGIGGFGACSALSTRNNQPRKASRPWDKDRDGFVIGEGSAVLVMESLDHAMRRGSDIYAEYLGGATNFDAHHMIDPRSDGLIVSSCITKALEDAGVSPQEVNYINADGTSTQAGDLAEVRGLKKVFKNTSEIKMNGTKSMIGHGMGASGGFEAIATIRAINTGWLHPTINQYNLEPEVTIDTVPKIKKKHQINVAISNSFGIGGHNSVSVFAPFTP